MIDEKTLAKWEHDAIDYGMLGYAEAFRFARRYLALRSEGVVIASGDWYKGPQVLTDEQLDAAADRLLETKNEQST